MEDILENWEGNHEFDDWYAVDEIVLGASDWTGPKSANVVRRLMVADRDRAADFAAKTVTGLNSLEEPGAVGEAPFFRMKLIGRDCAHDYFEGCLIDGCGNRMLPMKEAAEHVGISKQAMHERITRGRIAAEMIGGVWYVQEASLLLWVPEK